MAYENYNPYTEEIKNKIWCTYMGNNKINY